MRSEALNIDCMEYMKSLPDNAFSLALVDPPYGITADHFGGGGENMRPGVKAKCGIASTVRTVRDEREKYYSKKKGTFSGGLMRGRRLTMTKLNSSWDAEPPSQEYFDELFRVSKNQIIWGGNYFPLPPTRCVVVWDKNQPWENFSQVEIAWTSFDCPAKLVRRTNTDPGKIHPTQKPVALYTYLLDRFAKPGDLILDTHLGSGSSRIAAYMKGLDFVGCELDEFYYLEQEERFARFLEAGSDTAIPEENSRGQFLLFGEGDS